MNVLKFLSGRIRLVFLIALAVFALLASKPEIRHAARVWNFSKQAPEVTTKMTAFQFQNQDRLYVSSYRFSYADQLTSASPRIRKKIMGSCLKECEIFMGYDNLSKLAEDAGFVQNLCLGKINMLPNPEILATQCFSTETRGIYGKKGKCYEFDNNEMVRKRYALSEMKRKGMLDDANRRGRQVLEMMTPVFCR